MWGKHKSAAAQFKFTEKTSKKAAFFRFWLPGVEVKGKSCEVFISKVYIIEKAKALDFERLADELAKGDGPKGDPNIFSAQAKEWFSLVCLPPHHSHYLCMVSRTH